MKAIPAQTPRRKPISSTPPIQAGAYRGTNPNRRSGNDAVIRQRAAQRSRASQPATVPGISQVVRERRTRPQTGGQRFQGSRPVREYQDAGSALKQISPAAPVLAAEYIACLVIVGATVLTGKGEYGDNMAQTMWRLTAVTAVFFVLALASMSEKLSGPSKAFGGLIVGAVLLKSVKSVRGVLDELSGQGTGEDKATLTSDLSTAEPPHNILNPKD